MHRESMDRRSFLSHSLAGISYLSLPPFLYLPPDWDLHAVPGDPERISATVRPPTLFAGIRKPIQSREELPPRIMALKEACGDRISGPLTHIFRYDTPVEGFDSEIGFPVDAAVQEGEIRTYTLRSMHFFSAFHEGPVETISECEGELYRYMYSRGLSAELELVEVFHDHDAVTGSSQRIEAMASFLPWPETYLRELTRVLGEKSAGKIWEGGEQITPHTPVDGRCLWVGESIRRLKERTTPEEQFDILSRVALIRPPEDIQEHREIYEEAGDIQAVFQAQQAAFLESGRVRGWIDPPWFDGRILHLSKPPYREEPYLAATTPEETRRAFCFCSLVREAEAPEIDPIFCYRAAGWARQLVEPILGVEFKRCEITHSILKGDRFCAWNYYLD